MKKKSKTQMPEIRPALKDAVMTYIAAEATMKTIKPKVEAYQAAVLADADLQYSDEFAPDYTGKITDMRHSWMMDGRQSDDFYAALDAARDAAGFTGYKPGFCPLLVAEDDVRKAKWLVWRKGAYLTGLDPDRYAPLDVVQQYVDATIALVLACCPGISSTTIMAKFTK